MNEELTAAVAEQVGAGVTEAYQVSDKMARQDALGVLKTQAVEKLTNDEAGVSSDDVKDVFLRTGNDIPTSTLEITMPRIILGAAWIKQFSSKISLVTELDLDFTTDGKRNVFAF